MICARDENHVGSRSRGGNQHHYEAATGGLIPLRLKWSARPVDSASIEEKPPVSIHEGKPNLFLLSY
jgi:hypothetical protein